MPWLRGWRPGRRRGARRTSATRPARLPDLRLDGDDAAAQTLDRSPGTAPDRLLRDVSDLTEQIDELAGPANEVTGRHLGRLAGLFRVLAGGGPDEHAFELGAGRVVVGRPGEARV